MSLTTEILENRWMGGQTRKYTLSGNRGTYRLVYQNQWKWDEVFRNRQAKPLNISLQTMVTYNPRAMSGVQTVTKTIHGVNTCPLLYKWPDGQFEYRFNYLASYVNEDHPKINEILQLALEAGYIERFTGYQTNDTGEVYKQVLAIWRVLEDLSIRYSSITRLAQNEISVGVIVKSCGCS